MPSSRWLVIFALAGIAGAPFAARAGEIYSYVDRDGVVHFSNAPTDRRYRRVARTNDVAGVYRSGGKAKGRALPSREAMKRYSDHVKAAAAKYALPEALLFAVMAVESNYNERAVSEKGATGLMQLMPGTAKDMFVGDVYDPVQNIEGGARYLRILANQYEGDMVKTLAAYNAGPEAVRRAGGGVPRIPETQEYVRKVLEAYESFKAGR
ncbi:MAG TPA: transglycosylase SLT domain-containing protein [Anaeromyxobacteraceae bacterium]|nr:transglycosylase SLT domain-containing protein [Anaeromyxobacteraceae bacterium]